MQNKIDEREPKEILKTELYLNAPMVRRILNCSYHKALEILNKGLKMEKEQELFIVDQRKLQIRTKTFKQMLGI